MDYDGLPKEERDRVFQLYTGQANSFRRSLNVLLITSAIVFALFVVPFLGFSVQLASVKENAAIAEQDRLQNEEKLARLQPDFEALDGLGQLLNRYNSQMVSMGIYEAWATEGRARMSFMQSKRAEYRAHSDPDLSAWANGEQATLNPDVHSRVRYVNMGIEHECEWRLNRDRESLNDYVACRTCESFRDLNDRVVRQLGPASRILPADAVPEVVLSPIADRACRFLLEGEAHWHVGQPLRQESRSIRGSLTHDIRAYRTALDGIRSQLTDQLSLRTEETAMLIAALDVARQEEAALLSELDALSKFDRLATPFGDVPITLNQLALLFPIAVAIGFLMVATNFGQMVRLRVEFCRLSAQFDTQGQVITPSYLDTIAPVWLSQRDPALTYGLKWVILLVPLALILTTYAMIQQSSTFAEPFPEGSAISSAAYYVLYALALGLVAGGVFHIWRASRMMAD